MEGEESLRRSKRKKEKMNPRALLALLACFSGDQQKVPLQVWTHWGLNPIADMSGWSHSGRSRKLAKIKTKEEKMNPRALLALLACFSGDQQKVPLQVWTHWGLNPGPSACGPDVIPLHHVPLVAGVSCRLSVFKKNMFLLARLSC